MDRCGVDSVGREVLQVEPGVVVGTHTRDHLHVCSQQRRHHSLVGTLAAETHLELCTEHCLARSGRSLGVGNQVHVCRTDYRDEWLLHGVLNVPVWAGKPEVHFAYSADYPEDREPFDGSMRIAVEADTLGA